ncbi:MAG TPA: Cj0069 family protein [Chitinophagaceae bacterium]|nr:Cj0069 family protein [Chitinophagaceae bacterium]
MSSIAILIYGKKDTGRDALVEEKYKDLAAAFVSQGYTVQSVLYSDDQWDDVAERLTTFNSILVWVNPVEQGNDRTRLDALLSQVSAKGCMVSTHPDVILKMGTKDILYKTRLMNWGSDIKMYTNFESFTKNFLASLDESKVRVLKQYRGNGGNGVFKIAGQADGSVSVTHAIAGHETRTLPPEDFFEEFRAFFSDNGLLIDQEWNKNITNGMVRCYVAGTMVAGFGYQEVNALYQDENGIYLAPSKRYYFTERCGIFSDLKEVMENSWIPELQKRLDISDDMMPVIWDADFFINSITSPNAAGKYTLCEINVSCVSPFPPSAIQFMVNEVGRRMKRKATSI